jgi:hypothetical protein
VSTAALAALQFAALLGTSHESTPPNGTWWQADQPHSFSSLDGPSYGFALVGSQWSLTAERMGRATSHALACGANEPACSSGRVPYSHWNGSEQPLGIWAAWEPHLGPVFAQLGAGAVKSEFHMSVPDWTAGGPPHPLMVGNTQILFSPLAGLGIRLSPHADLLANWRLVRAQNVSLGPTQTQYQGLGWSVFNVSVRWRF